MRWRITTFAALSRVMIIFSWRVGPRLPAKSNAMTKRAALESMTLVLVATVGAGQSAARKRAGRALPLDRRLPLACTARQSRRARVGAPVSAPGEVLSGAEGRLL